MKNMEQELIGMRTTERQLREGTPTIDDMRHDLAEQEAMNMGFGDIVRLLKNGFEGLENIPDIEVRDQWNDFFGEEDE